MKAPIAAALLVALLGCQTPPSAGPSPRQPRPPKLIVPILIDGLGQHQVMKHAGRFGAGGFRRLLEEGAWFSDARYGHSTTITAVGHGTWLTGAYPYRHGMVSNDWYDRKTKKVVYCTEDPDVHYLGEPTREHQGTSPKNLAVTTVGDELRVATDLKSRVFAVSLKDRGAILPAGRLGVPYFYSAQTGRFISSDFYLEEFPEWWSDFQRGNPQNRWFGKVWTPLLPEEAYAGCYDEQTQTQNFNGLGKKFPHKVAGLKPEPGSSYYSAIEGTPFGHEYLVEFAKALITHESLGKNPDGVPDLCAISFSSHDFINHVFGPESAESMDDLLRLDRTLAALFQFLDGWVGLDQTLVVLTADHGFSYSPEYWSDVFRMDAKRIEAVPLLKKLNEHLEKAFGVEKLAAAWRLPTIWLDYDLIDSKKLARPDVEREAATFLGAQPGIHSVFTRTQLSQGLLPQTRLAQLVSRSWVPQRSGDLLLVQQDGWFFKEERFQAVAMHGSPWTYDARVPVMFLGRPWIRPGSYAGPAEPTDIAPTLSQLLSVPPPSGCEGRTLTEILR